jgi:CRP/FNR family transcriptional regulator, cyclic AMP receptor protein
LSIATSDTRGPPRGAALSATFASWAIRGQYSLVEWRLLEGVPAEDVRRLIQVARRRTFRRGEVVFHRDDPGDSMHLIASGRFAVRVMAPLGDQVTIAVRGPGESFGEMALVGGGRRLATVEALDSAETYCVYKDDFDLLRRSYPQVTELVIVFLTNEVRMLNERLIEALYVGADLRVLRRLSEVAALYRQESKSDIVVPLTQEQLATLAGTSRATVNATLGDAQRRGIIDLRRGKISVRDPAALAARGRIAH